MAQYTPNFNLYEPDSSDDFADFRTEFNNNMDIIDQNLGGGGGSGGHTIIDENGQSMTQRTGLEFTGNVQVTDDSVNDKTIVDILGGGGNVYGAFIDPSRIIVSSAYTSNLSYTATEDCFIYTAVALNSNTGGSCAIDGQNIASWWNGSGGTVAEAIGSYLKKGQTFTATATNASSSGYVVYGLTQGTNGIYAPVIYSDVERVIGVWRDNKPLYQRTFVLSSPINVNGSGTLLPNDIQTALADVEIMVDSECARDSTYSAFISPYVYKSGGQWYILSADNWGNVKFITLRYTKTTDVAGSGNWNTDGVPTHHYSTSEQVVGTWVNNKPLYEKSFVFTPTALTTSIDVSGLQIEDLIERKGTFTRNAGSQIQQKAVDYRTESPASNNYGIQCELRDTNLHVNINGYAYTEITQFRITLQYTKTTD